MSPFLLFIIAVNFQFRNVIPAPGEVEVARQFDALIGSSGVRFESLPLRTPPIPGLYIQDSVRPEFRGAPAELHARLVVSLLVVSLVSFTSLFVYISYVFQGTRLPGEHFPLRLYDAGAMVDRMFNAFAPRRLEPLYAANVDVGLPVGMPDYLHDVSGNLHPSVNDDVGVCAGINRPSFYLSGRHAYSALHVEDGFSESCNLMHWAIGDAFKVWDCFHPTSFHDIGVSLRESIGKLRARRYDVSSWLVGCPVPHHHKNLVVTSPYPAKNNLLHQYVIQGPQDLVYVDGSVHHLVAAFGITFAAAVNVGSSRWNLGANKFITCCCAGCAIKPIARNESRYEIVRSHEVATRHVCPFRGCAAAFSRQEAFEHHLLLHAMPDLPEADNTCGYCHRIFASLENLQAHVQQFHPRSTVTDVVACSTCQKFFASKAIAAHQRLCVVGAGVCPYCGKEYSLRGIASHKRACRQHRL